MKLYQIPHRFNLHNWVEFFTKDSTGQVFGHKKYPTAYGESEQDNLPGEWISDSNYMQRMECLDIMFESVPWEVSLMTIHEVAEIYGLTMVRFGDA